MEHEVAFEDSNIALLGSDIEKELRKKKADTEPEWQKLKKEPGIMIWRIEKFNVVPWPKDQYGSFYQGDSYIVLHIEKDGDALVYTGHMWIGRESTQDERGTAAYKIVELDDFFQGNVELVYEGQGDETDEFKALFPSIIYMEGGIASGFKKVEPTLYQPRLLHVHKDPGQNTQVDEVERLFSSLNSDDAFIVDGGLKLYVWRGKGASGFEMNKAISVATQIKTSRNSNEKIDILDEGDAGTLKIMQTFLTDDQGEKRTVKLRSGRKRVPPPQKKMFRLSDETGELKMTEFPDFKKENLESKDSFLIDAGKHIYIWVGKDASPQEKRLGFAFGGKYARETHMNGNASIHIIKEGSKKIDLDAIFA